MKNNFLKYLMLGCSAMVFLNACVKDKYSGTQSAGQGPSYIRITEAKVNNMFFSPFLDIKTVNMFSVQRDAASSDALQTTNTVVLTDVTTTYLAAHTSLPYSAMPSTLYTIVPQAGLSTTATTYTLNFAPGDFAKNIIFKIDGSKIDLSKQYGIVFAISNTGGLTRKAGLDTILATVAIKNKYDGVYAVVGSMVDITNATLTDANTFFSSSTNTSGLPAPVQIELRTTSANTCDVFDNYYYGNYYYLISSGTALSQYGNFCPSLTFDLATDKVTAVVNHYGQPQAAVGRGGRLDPTGAVNAYVGPAAGGNGGKITIKFNMTQPQAWNGNPTSCPLCSNVAPYVRSTWDQVWTYVKSR